MPSLDVHCPARTLSIDLGIVGSDMPANRFEEAERPAVELWGISDQHGRPVDTTPEEDSLIANAVDDFDVDDYLQSMTANGGPDYDAED